MKRLSLILFTLSLSCCSMRGAVPLNKASVKKAAECLQQGKSVDVFVNSNNDADESNNVTVSCYIPRENYCEKCKS